QARLARKLSPEHSRSENPMIIRSSVLVSMALLVLFVQETHSLHAERTVDFQTRKVYDLKAQVGQVRIASVELTDMGRGFGQGGIASRMRGGAESEASTILRAHFLTENPT